MKIKMLKEYKLSDRELQAGEIVDVNSEHADYLVSSGFAVRHVAIETREPALENRDHTEKPQRQSPGRKSPKLSS